MAYQGNSPALNYISFAKQTFSIVNGQTSYTLDNSVANGLEILLYINNVKQEEGSGKAYTASGNTLTIASALTSGSDEMYCLFIAKAVQSVVPPSGSVTNAMLGETITVAKGGTGLTSGFENGITEADQFRTTATISNPSGVIDVNFERADNATFAKIGTGMTESSGLFTFPVTGLYLVEWNYTMHTKSDNAVNFFIRVTANNGASFDNVARTIMGNIDTSTEYNVGRAVCFVNVTDVSNFKVHFYIDGGTSNLNLIGNTVYNVTSYTFIRLGDSQ